MEAATGLAEVASSRLALANRVVDANAPGSLTSAAVPAAVGDPAAAAIAVVATAAMEYVSMLASELLTADAEATAGSGDAAVAPLLPGLPIDAVAFTAEVLPEAAAVAAEAAVGAEAVLAFDPASVRAALLTPVVMAAETDAELPSCATEAELLGTLLLLL